MLRCWHSWHVAFFQIHPNTTSTSFGGWYSNFIRRTGPRFNIDIWTSWQCSFERMEHRNFEVRQVKSGTLHQWSCIYGRDSCPLIWKCIKKSSCCLSFRCKWKNLSRRTARNLRSQQLMRRSLQMHARTCWDCMPLWPTILQKKVQIYLLWLQSVTCYSTSRCSHVACHLGGTLAWLLVLLLLHFLNHLGPSKDIISIEKMPSSTTLKNTSFYKGFVTNYFYLFWAKKTKSPFFSSGLVLRRWGSPKACSTACASICQREHCCICSLQACATL